MNKLIENLTSKISEAYRKGFSDGVEIAKNMAKIADKEKNNLYRCCNCTHFIEDENLNSCECELLSSKNGINSNFYCAWFNPLEWISKCYDKILNEKTK